MHSIISHTICVCITNKSTYPLICSTWEEMYDEQTQRSAENGDRFNRMTLDCQTTSGSSRAHSSSETIIELSIGVFFLIWVAVGIWIVFVKRQKAMNAAAITPYSGNILSKFTFNYFLHR